jgi:hypothetical protein
VKSVRDRGEPAGRISACGEAEHYSGGDRRLRGEIYTEAVE